MPRIKPLISRRTFVAAAFGAVASSIPMLPAAAGDSIYGKVTQIKGPDLVVLDYGAGQYDIRIVGIRVPAQAALSTQATALLSSLVLNKNARMRLVEDEAAERAGQQSGDRTEIVARLTTDDPVTGIKDVAIELVKAGLVRKQPAFDYKYGELAAAEGEARGARRGVWSAQ
jgi:endonuclease YncB( thermonuclease family)